MTNFFFKLFFFLLLLNRFPLVAEIQDINVEVRSGAFFHSPKRFREIYGSVGVSYQLEATTHLCNCWDGWANFDWFSDHGKPKDCDAKTRVSIASISFGVKYPYQFCERYIAYIGIGPSISRIWLKNRSGCEHERISKLAIGGVLKSGIYYFITCNIFLTSFSIIYINPFILKNRSILEELKQV